LIFADHSTITFMIHDYYYYYIIIIITILN
jgi:hypothetical protein